MSTGSVRPSPAPASGVVTSVTARSSPQAMPPASCGPSPPSRRAASRPPAPGQPAPFLDVQEPDVLRVALDERAPGLDVLAHQHAEQLISLSRVVERYLLQHPAGRVHRGVPQLGRVHLAQSLEPLHATARPGVTPALGD